MARITFEVSVRLLGGLMALGYTIATILKRVSKVYSDDVLCVKVDKLELLQQKFIQVQGKDRTLVEEAAKKLGLEGSYMPHPYIEQIQLQSLTAEVMEIPDDLKTKLSIMDTPSSSPLPSFSWMSEAKPGVKRTHSKSVSIAHVQSKANKQSSFWGEPTETRLDDRCLDSPTSFQGEQCYAHFSEQMSGLNERIDELLSRLGDVETKLSSCIGLTQGRQGTGIGSFGNVNRCVYGNMRSMAGNGYSPSASSLNTASSLDLPVSEELRNLAQGQRHLTSQLDVVSNILRQTSVPRHCRDFERRGWWDAFLGRTKTMDTGLITALGLITSFLLQ